MRLRGPHNATKPRRSAATATTARVEVWERNVEWNGSSGVPPSVRASGISRLDADSPHLALATLALAQGAIIDLCAPIRPPWILHMAALDAARLALLQSFIPGTRGGIQ